MPGGYFYDETTGEYITEEEVLAHPERFEVPEDSESIGHLIGRGVRETVTGAIKAPQAGVLDWLGGMFGAAALPNDVLAAEQQRHRANEIIEERPSFWEDLLSGRMPSAKIPLYDLTTGREVEPDYGTPGEGLAHDMRKFVTDRADVIRDEIDLPNMAKVPRIITNAISGGTELGLDIATPGGFVPKMMARTAGAKAGTLLDQGVDSDKALEAALQTGAVTGITAPIIPGLRGVAKGGAGMVGIGGANRGMDWLINYANDVPNTEGFWATLLNSEAAGTDALIGAGLGYVGNRVERRNQRSAERRAEDVFKPIDEPPPLPSEPPLGLPMAERLALPAPEASFLQLPAPEGILSPAMQGEGFTATKPYDNPLADGIAAVRSLPPRLDGQTAASLYAQMAGVKGRAQLPAPDGAIMQGEGFIASKPKGQSEAEKIYGIWDEHPALRPPDESGRYELPPEDIGPLNDPTSPLPEQPAQPKPVIEKPTNADKAGVEEFPVAKEEPKPEVKVPEKAVEPELEGLADIKPEQIPGVLEAAKVSPQVIKSEPTHDIVATSDMRKVWEMVDQHGRLFGKTAPVLGESRPIVFDNALLSEMRLDPENFQFRSGTGRGGIKQDNRIEGDYDSGAKGQFVVFEPLEGDRATHNLQEGELFAVADGHHRKPAFEERGVTEPQRVIILRAKDGWTPELAKMYAAEINLKQGTADVGDAARFFREAAKVYGRDAAAAARARIGELSRKGRLARQGEIIGLDATESVYRAFAENGTIQPEQALAIAKAFPGDKRLQDEALEFAKIHDSPKALAEELEGIQAREEDFFKGDPRLRKQAWKDVLSEARRDPKERKRQLASLRDPNNKLLREFVSDVDVVGGKTAYDRAAAEDSELRRALKIPRIKQSLQGKVEARYKELVELKKKGELQTGLFGELITNESGMARLGEPIGAISDFFWRAFKKDIKKLPEGQRFLQGRSGHILPGRVGDEVVAAYRDLMAFQNTLGEKIPAYNEAYNAGRDSLREVNTIVNNLKRAGEDYWNLKPSEQTRVDALIAKIGKESRAQLRKGGVLREPSDERLISNGYSKREIAAIRSFFRIGKEARPLINEYLLLKGRKLQGEQRDKYVADVNEFVSGTLDKMLYAPQSRFGDTYAVKGQLSDGTYYRSHHDSLNAARKAIKELQKEGGIGQIEEMPERGPVNTKDVPPEFHGIFQDAEQVGTNYSGSLGGIGKHLIFTRDVPGAETNLRRSMSDYITGVARSLAKEKARAKIENILDSLPKDEKGAPYEPAVEVKIREYLTDVVENGEGGGVRSKITNLMNWTYLYGVPMTGLVNSSSAITATLPELVGRSKSAVTGSRIWGKALKDLSVYLAQSGKGALTGKKPTSEAAVVLQRAIKEGVVDSGAISQLGRWSMGRVGSVSPTEVFAATFTIPEKLTRMHSVLAGYYLGKSKGLSPNRAFEYAVDFSFKTQGDYSKFNQPKAARNPVGKLALQYKLWPGFMIRTIRRNAGQHWPAAALAIGIMTSAAGAYGLPGVRDVKNLIESWFGKDINAAAKRFIGDDTFSDAILHGLPTLGGVDLSGAIGTGEFSPGMDTSPSKAIIQTLTGPAGSTVFKVGKAAEAYRLGEPDIAAELILPRMVRGPLKAARISREGNDLRDMRGNLLLEDVSLADKVKIALGATPTNLTKKYEALKSQALLKNRAMDNNDVNLRLAKALFMKDREQFAAIMEEVQEHNAGAPMSEQIIPNQTAISDAYIRMLDPNLGAIREMPTKARPELMGLQALYGSR